MKGDVVGASADYDQAIALNPRFAEAYENRGILRLQQGKEAEAEPDFVQCFALDPHLRPTLERRIRELKQQLATRRLQ